MRLSATSSLRNDFQETLCQLSADPPIHLQMPLKLVFQKDNDKDKGENNDNDNDNFNDRDDDLRRSVNYLRTPQSICSLPQRERLYLKLFCHKDKGVNAPTPSFYLWANKFKWVSLWSKSYVEVASSGNLSLSSESPPHPFQGLQANQIVLWVLREGFKRFNK